MKRLFIAVVLMAVAAPAAAAPYRALGTEPFWSLTIDREIRFEPVAGRTIHARTPRAQTTRDGVIYHTPFVTVQIAHRSCSDGMSDRTYADTVRVRIGLKRLNGCGGRIVHGRPQPR